MLSLTKGPQGTCGTPHPDVALTSPENTKFKVKPNEHVSYVEKELGDCFIRPQPSSCFPVPCRPNSFTAEEKERPAGGSKTGRRRGATGPERMTAPRLPVLDTPGVSLKL